jgi:hypothetical protein
VIEGNFTNLKLVVLNISNSLALTFKVPRISDSILDHTTRSDFVKCYSKRDKFITLENVSF